MAIRLVGHAEAGPGHPETDKQYKIAPEVPGVEEKDIQITLDNDVLMVRGEKRREQEKKEGGFHRVERSYGSFQRALNLPDDANRDSIKASFKNGVLTVTIDKREVSAPKQDARSRSTADVAGSFVTRKTRHETRSRGSRCLVASTLSTLSTFSGASAWPEKQCQVCGQPATVRVEANLNGRHSTMLLCDDHYRQLVRQQKRTVSPLEALFGSRSGLFEDFLGSDFFRIGDDATPVAADTDDVVDASFGEPAAAGSGAPRRRGSGLASRISEQSEALLQEAAKHAAEFGRSEVDTEHLLLALADSDVVKTIPGRSRSRSMTSSGRSSLRPSAGTSPSRARSACRRA